MIQCSLLFYVLLLNITILKFISLNLYLPEQNKRPAVTLKLSRSNETSGKHIFIGALPTYNIAHDDFKTLI